MRKLRNITLFPQQKCRGVYNYERGCFPSLKFRMGDFLPQSANPGAVRTPRKIINRQYTSFYFLVIDR